MSRTTHRRVEPLAAGKTPTEQLADQTFARNLHNALIRNRMSASDLARAIWGNNPSGTGARNRDRISAYLSGRSIPEPTNLAAIAKALSMTVEELAPDITASAVDRANPELALTMIAGRADLAHLRIDKLVPLDTASQVIALISAAEKTKADFIVTSAKGTHIIEAKRTGDG